MEIILGFGAGLLTLINPCILPVLPIVLAGAIQAGKWGPVAMAAGMSVAFVVLGLGVAALGFALGIGPEVVSQAAAVFMVLFGLALLVPRVGAQFATATAGFASGADAQLDEVDRGSLWGQALGGALLGAVWSPCIGPTLGAAISLASQGESLVWAGAIMSAFALGVSAVILALGYGARSVILKRQAWMRAVATSGRPILGAVFVAVGLAILFGVHHMVEQWAVETLPYWLQDLSVAL